MCARSSVPSTIHRAPRIEAETAAVMSLLGAAARGEHVLVWSSALAYENDADPEADIREAVADIGETAEERLILTEQVGERAEGLHANGLGTMDAIHLALAESANCEALVTCDDRFCRAAARIRSAVRVLNPVELWQEIGRGSAHE